ncbi:MAG: aminomethyl-transferring glycine dehydrogenase subunit GcvPA [Candidatus Omnitrophica bacterium]|nr:aminomethyl-transferring glycine dehydrogenase subunit GcvPA [Candidatus Omnitrophota bacterium]MCF7878326.1 aminomethyl-transferring glycine dehydrogenase subunit GcvPA [Candidatus Omnitrophota bacterium]
MDYIPHTPEEIKKMLDAIGVSSLDELFSDIDKSFFSDDFDLPPGKSEFEVFDYFKNIARKTSKPLVNLSGAGFYDHYIPAVVDKLANRSEFSTPYTPYQPECSQATLQAIYEYQTLICSLTGMDIANASVYDGGTALAESIIMASRITKRKKIIIDSLVNPIYQKIIKTYINLDDYQIIVVDSLDFATDKDKFIDLIDTDTSAVVLQNPNFLGKIDDHTDLIKQAHKNKALAILSVYPTSLGLLKTPASMGADIVTGEAQCLGNSLNFGGPFLGFIATLEKNIRQLPGRIVGATEDSKANRGFVLTLQAREQHIRRHKATSNICTNQNLCAIKALIYLVALGKKGFRKLSETNYHKAQFARREFSKIDKVKVNLDYPIFNEFVVEVDTDIDKLYEKMLEEGFIAGVPLIRFYPEMKNKLLICITEKITKEYILKFKKTLETLLNR